ncbi:omega-hydroxypalmitate O-feruloyl transferase-like [Amborella trichopoda]|uniref:omega-hydroxypalmitate O-feruloyl transferase-like n=1 Tax=Amborella trichopoda TaxID=13333 RepID=UPI0009BF3E64|nr:omega-hydroxypalmitate O-feruloyl transferase-like [Amborella trichopoda]|eukprot:XP_020526551.1 omega-hydroxypalmitate O-feruloyl transferase-like [Amborella trichopoda]
MLTFSSRDPLNSPTFSRALPPPPHLLFIPQHKIDCMKEEALQDGKIKRCTVFQVMVAKIWRARTLALGLPDERTSTVLFPIDVRKRMVPPLPANFAGNALVPGFARASARELREEGASFCVSKVQEGLERLFDAYVRSGIDWLEVHKGVPSAVDSFSVVSWLRLVMEGLEFEWAEAGCITPITVNTGLVMLLASE